MCVCVHKGMYNNMNIERTKGKIKCIALTEQLHARVVFCNYRMFLMDVINGVCMRVPSVCVCVCVRACAFCLVRECCFGSS